MKTLTVSTGSFDQVNTFSIAQVPYSTCSLHRDYQVAGDGILWVMQHAGCLKAVYSDADKAESARLQTPAGIVNDGEIVKVEGKKYKVRVLGKFSNCALLDPVVKARIGSFNKNGHWTAGN